MPDWLMEVLDRQPPVDWTAYPQAPTSGAAHIPNAAYLHTDACGDFTLLSRDDWFALRGYPEFPIWPCISTRCSATQPTMPVSAKWFCANRCASTIRNTFRLPAGLRKAKKSRVARIEAKGVTEIQFATWMEWIDRMRRFNAPMIFTLSDWGLAGVTLPETTVQAKVRQ